MSVTPPTSWELFYSLKQRPDLFQAIEESSLSEFQLQQELRSRFPVGLVPAALTLAELRLKAQSKFAQASRMWFDRISLEQSTSELVARYKANRFLHATTPEQQIWDYCCGCGGDTLAMMKHRFVLAIDSDPLRLLQTEWNAKALQPEPQLKTCCAQVELLPCTNRIIHIDPDRRVNAGKRSLKIEQSKPSLGYLQQLTRLASGGGIKLSPASNFGGKFPDCETELISLNKECKEATIWFGQLKSDVVSRATLLPSGETIAGNPLEFYPRLESLKEYLFDPDPAVVRAGLIDALSEKLNLGRLDGAEEYLTSERLVSSPFVTPFQVVAQISYHLKDLRKWFRSQHIGQLEIKCRHIPVQIEKLRKKLDLKGNEQAVLFIAKLQGKAAYLVTKRVAK